MAATDVIALVTGASSGIGRAVARGLVARGGRVALVARTASALEALASELGRERAVAFPLDVTDRAAVAALPAQVVARLGGLDVLVNNAGANHRGPVAESRLEDLAQVLDTNLMAPVLLTRASLPHLGRGGMVVNVASLAGKVPVPDQATYSASKAGLRAFGRALDTELREAGIRVCNVNPGPVDTGFFGDLRRVPDLVFSQPMRSPEQVAVAVLRAIDTRAQEIDIPALSGRLATLGYLSPRLYAGLRPLLVRIGARNKRRLMEQRARDGEPS